MVAHVPIPPRKASDIVCDAQIAPPADVLADFAEAGLVKGYARLTETVFPDGRREEVRDRRIPRELWRRIISEGKVADVSTGTVRLAGSPEFGGGPKVTLIGIRFDDQSIKDMAARHGTASSSSSSSSGPPPSAAAAVAPSKPKPVSPMSAMPLPVLPLGDHCAEQDHGPLFQPPGAKALGKAQPIISPDAKAVSIEEALTILPVGRTKLYELIKKGKLTLKKVGRRSMIPMSDINRLIE